MDSEIEQRAKLGNYCNNPFKKLSGSERVMARWGKVEKNDSRYARLAESIGDGDWLDIWDRAGFKECEE